MKQIALLSLGFGVLIANQAAACKNVRLDGKGMPLSRTAVLDQDGVDDCFASAAAILVDSWRFSHDPPVGDKNYSHLTMPLHMAVENAARHPGSTLHTGGSAAQVLKDIKEYGSCDPTKTKGSEEGLSPELSKWLRTQYQDLQSCKDTAAITNGEATDKPGDDAVHCHLKGGLTTSMIPDLKSVEKVLGSDSTLEALKQAMTVACPKDKRQAVGGYTVNYHPLKSADDFGKDVEKQFDQPSPQQPMTVGICANIFSDEKYTGVNFVPGKGAVAQPSCEPHEVVIIGQEEKDGVCYGIVQNSWGTRCNSISKKLKCEGGKISVPMDVLGANALETTHLEVEPKTNHLEEDPVI